MGLGGTVIFTIYSKPRWGKKSENLFGSINIFLYFAYAKDRFRIP